jgi:CCR4-NOT complex subunit CAF16
MLQVDLDVLVRADLMSFLKEESEHRGCTIVYITHIFDGMEDWPTHLGFMTNVGFEAVASAEEVPELKEGRLMELVEAFLVRQRKRRLEALASGSTVQHPEAQHQRDYASALNNGYSAGRLASTVK